ncbi:hypothetical protein RKD48_005870 [Streptomyces ambofaciens]
MLHVQGVAEPPVVQAHPALALEALDAGALRGGGAAEQGAAQARRGQVQRALHRQLRGVQRVPRVRVEQAGAAQAQRHADLGAAQAHLAVRLQHLGLEVLPDRHAVGRDGTPAAVAVHDRLVEQQVGAYPRVREPDAAREAGARQVQVALGVQPGRLKARHRAVHQAHRREPGLRQQHLALEAAAAQLHVGHHRAARQVHRVADPHAHQLQRGDPARERRRTVEEQPAHHAGAHRPLRSPRAPAVRVVDERVAAAQVVHAAVAERLPHPGLGDGQVVRQLSVTMACPLGHGASPPSHLLVGRSPFVQPFMPTA